MIKFNRIVFAALAILLVSAKSANATSVSWNPVFDHVQEVRVSVPVREAGLEFDRVGSLLEGQESRFWIRRAELKKIAFDEVSRIIGASRPDIKLYSGSFQSVTKFSTDPIVGPYENGRRTLSLALNVKSIDGQGRPQDDCYVGAVTATLIRGGFVGPKVEGGYRAEQEAEYLSTDGGYFTVPILACGDNDEIDRQLRTGFSQVIHQVSDGLAIGDKREP